MAVKGGWQGWLLPYVVAGCDGLEKGGWTGFVGRLPWVGWVGCMYGWCRGANLQVYSTGLHELNFGGGSTEGEDVIAQDLGMARHCIWARPEVNPLLLAGKLQPFGPGSFTADA